MVGACRQTAASCSWPRPSAGLASPSGWRASSRIGAIQSGVKHAIPDMIRARIFAIACGYEDCNDFGPLRADPAFKLACGRLPETGAGSRLSADPLASGECPEPARCDPPDLCSGRSVDGQLCHARRMAWCWTSTTPVTWCTGISSCRCSTPIMTSAAFCRSMSTTAPPADRSPSCCGRARRPRAWRCGRICAGWCAASGRAGLSRTSRSAATVTMPVPRPWTFCEQNGLSYLFGLAGTTAAHRQSPGCGGCGAHPQGGGRPRGRSRLCRDDAPGQELVVRAPGGRPHRGHPPGARHPLCGHQPDRHQPARRLREPVLCPRPGGELDQVPQGATRLRPDLVPASGGQSGSARAAHGRLLADAGACARPSRPLRDLARAEFATLRLRLLKIAVRVQETTSRIRLAFASVLPGRGSLPPSGRGSHAQPAGGLALSDGAAIAPITPSLPRQRVPHVPNLAAVKETQRISTPELQIKSSQPDSGEYDRLASRAYHSMCSVKAAEEFGLD